MVVLQVHVVATRTLPRLRLKSGAALHRHVVFFTTVRHVNLRPTLEMLPTVWPWAAFHTGQVSSIASTLLIAAQYLCGPIVIGRAKEAWSCVAQAAAQSIATPCVQGHPTNGRAATSSSPLQLTMAKLATVSSPKLTMVPFAKHALVRAETADSDARAKSHGPSCLPAPVPFLRLSRGP